MMRSMAMVCIKSLVPPKHFWSEGRIEWWWDLWPWFVLKALSHLSLFDLRQGLNDDEISMAMWLSTGFVPHMKVRDLRAQNRGDLNLGAVCCLVWVWVEVVNALASMWNSSTMLQYSCLPGPPHQINTSYCIEYWLQGLLMMLFCWAWVELKLKKCIEGSVDHLSSGDAKARDHFLCWKGPFRNKSGLVYSVSLTIGLAAWAMS